MTRKEVNKFLGLSLLEICFNDGTRILTGNHNPLELKHSPYYEVEDGVIIQTEVLSKETYYMCQINKDYIWFDARNIRYIKPTLR
jgi:hypothetical protein